ncbi:MAG: fixJ [Rhodospirillales bacterium]|nr:fixJ [Rhodospirillales bacterium]
MTNGNIYIVDDDHAVRDSLQMLLEASGYAVRAFASAQAFLNDVGSLDFGCLIVDLQMPEMDGLELQRQLAERGIKLPTVVVTAHGDVATAVRAMRAGAVDFVEKPFSDEAIHAGIRLGLAERPKPNSADQMRTAIRERLKILSPREREVLDGMVAGHPNKVIAYKLSLSPRTVEIHRARVMDKMQARSLSELVRLALAAGLTPEGAI